jgi:hypothetical protein
MTRMTALSLMRMWLRTSRDRLARTLTLHLP